MVVRPLLPPFCIITSNHIKDAFSMSWNKFKRELNAWIPIFFFFFTFFFFSALFRGYYTGWVCTQMLLSFLYFSLFYSDIYCANILIYMFIKRCIYNFLCACCNILLLFTKSLRKVHFTRVYCLFFFESCARAIPKPKTFYI